MTATAMIKSIPQQESQDPMVGVTQMGHCSRLSWDAFILFGAGRTDEFRTLAKKAKDKGVDSGFSLLLGLSRIDGDKGGFEDVAVDYAVQFGQSPPSWFEGHTRHKSNVPTSIEVSVPSFDVDTIIETTVKMEIPRPLVIDFSSAKHIEAAGIDLFQEALHGRLERGHKTKLINGSTLVIDILKKLAQMPGNQPRYMWEFCFTYYRLSGMKPEFDAAAQEFIRLGGTIPTWTDLSEPVPTSGPQSSSLERLQAPSRLAGLTPEMALKFLASPQGLKAKAAGEVIVDMSQTSSASLLEAMGVIEFINVFKQSKMRVSLLNVNEIIAAMFQALAIDGLVEALVLPGVS